MSAICKGFVVNTYPGLEPAQWSHLGHAQGAQHAGALLRQVLRPRRRQLRHHPRLQVAERPRRLLQRTALVSLAAAQALSGPSCGMMTYMTYMT